MIELTFSRFILAQKDRQLGEDAHVRSLQAKPSFQQANDFFKVAATFIHDYQTTKLFGMYNDIETTNLCLNSVSVKE